MQKPVSVGIDAKLLNKCITKLRSNFGVFFYARLQEKVQNKFSLLLFKRCAVPLLNQTRKDLNKHNYVVE